jgi:hypothetical protein
VTTWGVKSTAAVLENTSPSKITTQKNTNFQNQKKPKIII